MPNIDFSALDAAYAQSAPFDLPDSDPHVGLIEKAEIREGAGSPYIAFVVYFPEFNKRRTLAFNLSTNSIQFTMRMLRLAGANVKKPSEIAGVLEGLAGNEITVQMKVNGKYTNYQFIKPAMDNVVTEEPPF